MNDAADISNSIRQGPGGNVGGGLRVAVVIPCYNEALAIEQVVQGFRAALPEADIHVMPYHTGSATTGDDDTAALIVRRRAAGKPSAAPIRWD